MNPTSLPSITIPPSAECRHAIIDSGIAIVEIASHKPQEHVDDFKSHGVKVVHKCSAVCYALSAERMGVDGVSIADFECAGHPGEDGIPCFILIPAAADELKVPMLASGGFGDGRGLVAALALGTEGINMSATKQSIVQGDERATALIFRGDKNAARVGRNAITEQGIADEATGRPFEEIAHLLNDARGKKVLDNGDPDHGVWTAGTVMGLIDSIPTCRQLIDRIMSEMEAIIGQRPARFERATALAGAPA